MDTVIRYVEGFFAGLPAWAHIVLVLFGGLVLSLLASVLARGFLKLVHFDTLSQKTGFDDFLHKGRISGNGRMFITRLVRWIGFFVTLGVAATWLDPQILGNLQERILTFLPGLLSALMILAAGGFIVSFAGNFTATVLRNAGNTYGPLVGSIMKGTGYLLVASIGVSQLNLNMTVFNVLLFIVAGSIGLGMALAFGLGCKDMAADAMKRWLRNLHDLVHTHDHPDLEG